MLCSSSKRSRGEDQVVQVAPDGPADARAQQRRDKHQQQQIEGAGAGEVELRLQRGVDGPQDIHEAEVRGRGAKEEQDHRMGEGKEDGQVRGPLMQQEDVDMAMGPVADGAVAQRDEQAEEEIDGGRSGSAEAEVRAEVQ